MNIQKVRSIQRVVVGDRTHDDFRQHGVAEQVAEQPDESCGRSGCILRHEVQRLNADQRHGTVDAEPDFAERRVDDRAADGGRVARRRFAASDWAMGAAFQ